MKLCLVRMCAILYCTCALACGPAFTTLEFSDADAGSDGLSSVYSPDSSSDVATDRSSGADTVDATDVSVTASGQDASTDLSDHDGDDSTPLDSGPVESGTDAVMEAGQALCCVINSGVVCAPGEPFPCSSPDVTCTSFSCIFTDPGNGTCTGSVKPCSQ